MIGIEMVITIISACIAGANAVGLLVMYRRYVELASAAVVFASEVVGHLAAVDETGEVEDPMGLIASSLDHLSQLSVMTGRV
jgi:hypothetical protein